MLNDEPIKVLAIALKTGPRGPMREVREATGAVDRGLDCPVIPAPDRGLTFFSARQWKDVQRELGTDLPWHTRRSNILLDAGSLGSLIGQTVRVGELIVRITGETRPCELMDEFCPGLRAALSPDFRAGVHGRILSAGRVCVGDTFNVITDE